MGADLLPTVTIHQSYHLMNDTMIGCWGFAVFRKLSREIQPIILPRSSLFPWCLSQLPFFLVPQSCCRPVIEILVMHDIFVDKGTYTEIIIILSCQKQPSCHGWTSLEEGHPGRPTVAILSPELRTHRLPARALLLATQKPNHFVRDHVKSSRSTISACFRLILAHRAQVTWSPDDWTLATTDWYRGHWQRYQWSQCSSSCSRGIKRWRVWEEEECTCLGSQRSLLGCYRKVRPRWFHLYRFQFASFCNLFVLLSILETLLQSRLEGALGLTVIVSWSCLHRLTSVDSNRYQEG